MQLPDDDLTVGDDEVLYRRVFPKADALQPKANGEYRPSSGALRSGQGPLSVDLASLSTPEETRCRDLTRPFHVAAISVRAAREVGCRVVRDPLSDNPAHCLLYGTSDDENGSIGQGLAKKLARKAFMILVNPSAPIPDA